MPTKPSIDAPEALVSMLEKNARNTDSAGVPPEQVAALREAGLIGASDAATQMEIGRALAHGCGATAWFATACSAGATVVARMDKAAIKDVGDSLVIPARISEGARIERARGSFLISGVWPAVGGLQHAPWVLLFGLEGDDGRYCALVSASSLNSEELTFFGGLRGLGWRRLEAKNLEVPAHRVFAMPDSDDWTMLGPLFGTAEAGHADYVRGTKARISGIGGKAVAEFTQVQGRLAESSADMKALRAIYADVLAKTKAGNDASVECARDRAYIARRSVEALNRLLSQMGAMGLAETNPVQRRSRDLRAFAASPGFTWNAQMAAFGRAELGITKPAAD
jgi:alkylation response protein AidB-like acyl-CoA dehydrogenase